MQLSELPNGLRIATIDRSCKLDTAYIGLFFDGGVKDDPEHISLFLKQIALKVVIVIHLLWFYFSQNSSNKSAFFPGLITGLCVHE